MGRTPSVKKVDRSGRFYHVRMRDPHRFTQIRTLTNTRDGRVRASRSCNAHGVKVGKSKRSGNWLIQSVLVRRRRGRDKNDAANAARCTVAKVEGLPTIPKTMARTPIPESTGEKLMSILKGPVLVIAWRLLLVLVFIAIIFVLVASGGFFGLFIASLLLSTLIRDDVRAAVSDLWNLRFWRVG